MKHSPISDDSPDDTQIACADIDYDNGNDNDAPLPRQTQALSDWQGFDQIPLTHVDPRYLTQVRIESGIIAILLMLAISLIAFFKLELQPLATLALVAAGLILASLIATVSYYHAKTLAYAICSHELLMQKGLIWCKRISLPYTRLQHISLSQGPLERRLGLHTLKCFSAGSGSAEIELPGLDSLTAEKMRQHLLTQASIAVQSQHSQTETSPAVTESINPQSGPPAPAEKR